MIGDPRLPAKFWDKVVPGYQPQPHMDSVCWIWIAAETSRGYGCWAVQGKPTSTHRITYETFVAPIPEGLTIDHLCRVKLCCNPAHLEAVTQAENNRRACAHITHCPQGHPYEGENLTTHGTRQARVCIACRREASRRYRANQKLRAA
jgi:hypothetical protein